MKKLSIGLGAGLIIIVFTTGLNGQTGKTFPRGDLIVQSIDILLPSGTGCTVQWRATIRNKGVEFPTDKSIMVRALQVSSDGRTKPAGDRSLGKLGPGETITTQPVSFNRWGYARLFRVVLTDAEGVVAESTVEFPQEPIAHSLSLENFIYTESTYTVVLKNPTPNGYADLTFQTYASKKDPPPADNAWLGAGGLVIPCLAGQSQYIWTRPLERGTKYIKVEIYRMGSRILRQVYDVRRTTPLQVTDRLTQTDAAAIRMDLPGQTKKGFPPGDLIVQSINIILPSGTGCALQWSAVIRNKGVEFPKGKSMTLRAYQVSDDGRIKPAGERPVEMIGPGKTITTQPLSFNRWGYGRLFKVVLTGSEGEIAEKTIKLPPEPIAHSFSLENFHLTASGYEVTLKNPTQYGFADLTFQTYASKKDLPPADNAWLGAGGLVIPCLAGQSQYIWTHSLEPGTIYLKIEIYRMGSRIMREVYDLRGMVPIKAVEKSTPQIKIR